MGEVKQLNNPAAEIAKVQNNITIDGVLTELEDWRANKLNANSAIPDELWKKILQLGERHSPSKIRRLLGVSTTQYNSKFEQFVSKQVKESATPATPIEFCEVKTTKPVYHPSGLPARNTIIVEFRRPDGQLMKLHTTTDNFRTVMALFFELGCDASDHLKT